MPRMYYVMLMMNVILMSIIHVSYCSGTCMFRKYPLQEILHSLLPASIVYCHLLNIATDIHLVHVDVYVLHMMLHVHVCFQLYNMISMYADVTYMFAFHRVLSFFFTFLAGFVLLYICIIPLFFFL